MTSFKKYNRSPTGYETFIYYDEVVLDHTYYVQFVYSGYSNEENENHEMTSETFQTNIFEIEDNDNENKNKNKDAEIVSRQLYQNLILFSSSSAVKVPLYIIDTLKFQLRDVIQRHS